MKILLCSIPDGAYPLKVLYPLIPRGKASARPIFPLGILRVLSSVEEHGYTGEIYDINNLRHSDQEIIENIKRTKPDVIGLSGPLSHCYPHMKVIAKLVRELFPNIWIIVGGNITGSSNVILNKTESDICVIGDGEIPFLKLLKYFKKYPTKDKINYEELNEIPGLAFMDENNKLQVTGFGEQLPAHKMGYPTYDRWEDGLEKFGGSRELVHEVFDSIDNLGELYGLMEEKSHRTDEILKLYEKLKNKKVGRIQSSKGCVAKCTFCQRATRGYRSFDPQTMEERIVQLKKNYNCAVLRVDDENFGSNRKQSYECAKVMKKHDMYWFAEGARASSITYEDLKFYKEHNMLAIRYGIESGSKKILEVMEKKITKEQVYSNISNTKKLGINTAVEVMMMGMPGETRDTVIETAEFAASLRYVVGNDWNTLYPVWAAAIPGTPLYEYTQQINLIGTTVDDEEKYLIRLADDMDDAGILNYLNKTDYDINEVNHWPYLYRYFGKKGYVKEIFKNNNSIIMAFKELYKYCIKEAIDRFETDKKRINNKLSFVQKIKTMSAISAKFLFSLSLIILPKFLLLQIIKKVADRNLKKLSRKYKVKDGPQRFNFFEPRAFIYDKNKITEHKMKNAIKPIDRSLRTLVKQHSDLIKKNETEEEKGLRILSRMQ